MTRALLLAALAAGLCGIRWGLPGPGRLIAFPERLKPAPAVAERFAAEWAKLYAGIKAAHETPGSEEPVAYAVGLERVRPGWDFPPPKLLNSYRSFLLQSGHPDEKKSFIILSQMRPWRLEFKPLYVQYGGAFIYPLGAFLGACHVLGLVHLTSGMTYYLLDPSAMGRLYLAGRVFMLLFQLGAVLLLYKLAARWTKPRTAAVAAVLGFLTPLALYNTHMIKPHPYAAFWALAACWYLLESNWVFCGLCAGMSAGGLFSMAPLLGLPLAGLLIGKKPNKDSVKGLLAGIAVFIITNPFVLFSFHDFRWDFAYGNSRPVALNFAQLIAGIQNMFSSVGILASLSGIIGVLFFAFGRDKEKALLARGTALLFIILYVKFAVFFLEDPAALRLFYVPVLLSFILGVSAVERLPKKAAPFIIILILSETALRGSVALANLAADGTPRSTFARAETYVDKALPAGSIGLPRYPEPSHTPPFRWDERELVIFQRPADLDGKPLPDWTVVDAMDIPAFEAWNAGRYRLLQDFAPVSLGPVTPEAYSPFVNQRIRVYEKNR